MGSVRSRTSLIGTLAIVGLVLGFALSPAQADVTKSFDHLWKQHIKPKISKPGTINVAKNPLEWTKLKNVPTDFADGVDATAQGTCAVGSFVTEIELDGSLVCDAPEAGGNGDITGVTAGTGLSGGGTTGDVSLGVNPAAVQTRLQSACAAGEMIRSVDQAGTVVCDEDDGSDAVIVQEQFETTGPQTNGYGTVFCPAGTHVMGGGASINLGIEDGSDTGVVLEESYPFSSTSWYAEATETTVNNFPWAIVVYVICTSSS